MIETRFLVADHLVPATALHAALGRLAGRGWRAALLAARQAVLESAKVTQPFASAALLAAGETEPLGDMLFRGDELFYVITKPKGRTAWRPATAPPAAGSEKPELEIGLISPARVSTSSRLAEFGANLAEALRASGLEDELTWRRPAAARMESLRQAAEWEPARATLQEFERAEAAMEPVARQLLERLEREGFARVAALCAGAEAESASAALANLARAGLVRRDLLISCHLSGRPLLLLTSPEQKSNAAVQQRQCPDCGLGLGDETIEEVAQPLITTAQQHSWPLVWLSERLNRLGMLSLLWWRAPDEWSPLGVVAGEFAGQTWLWAISSQRVDEDEVRALDRLRRRFNFDRLGVIALGGFAPAARRSLEIARPPALLAGSWKDADEVLETSLREAALRYAALRLSPLESAAGFPILATLRVLYSHPS